MDGSLIDAFAVLRDSLTQVLNVGDGPTRSQQDALRKLEDPGSGRPLTSMLDVCQQMTMRGVCRAPQSRLRQVLSDRDGETVYML